MGKADLEIVPKAMMQELEDAKKEAPSMFFRSLMPQGSSDFEKTSEWFWPDASLISMRLFIEREIKLIKHIWLNDPQFKAKKYIVRTKYLTLTEDHLYVIGGPEKFKVTWNEKKATQFDTKEEAEKWTNPQTEVVEVKE